MSEVAVKCWDGCKVNMLVPMTFNNMHIFSVDNAVCAARRVSRSWNADPEEQGWALDADINRHLGYCLDRQKSKSLVVCYCSCSVCTGLKPWSMPILLTYIKFANLMVAYSYTYSDILLSQAVIHIHKLNPMVNYYCPNNTAIPCLEVASQALRS